MDTITMVDTLQGLTLDAGTALNGVTFRFLVVSQ
jgi:hypothetical protein